MANEATLSFRLSKPPAEVFPYLSDLERAPEWVPDLVSVSKLTEGPLGIGTRYSEVVNLGAKMGTVHLEVTHYEPDRLFAHKGVGGPMEFTGRFTLEPQGDGTLVTHTYAVQLNGMARLMAPLIKDRVRKLAEAGIQNLQRALDG
jgi:carbon monoxide dehydrogenase subunit G